MSESVKVIRRNESSNDVIKVLERARGYPAKTWECLPTA